MGDQSTVSAVLLIIVLLGTAFVIQLGLNSNQDADEPESYSQRGNIQIVNSSMTYSQKSDRTSVTGTVKNTADGNLSYIDVRVEFVEDGEMREFKYEKSHEVFEPGETYNFETSYEGEAENYQILVDG